MATITCPQCLSQVDDGESICPRCGHLLSDDVSESMPIYVEERRWTFGNTLIVILLLLLIAAVGFFLYLNGLKWPYEDAQKYYKAEKAAYEQQITDYQNAAATVAEKNEILDAKMEEVNALINSGEEPLDPAALSAAASAVRVARSVRMDAPVIEAGAPPVPAKDSIFHAKEIRETAKIIDQQRFTLYQQYSSLVDPDYSAAIQAMDKAETALKESIQRRKESEAVSAQLKQTLDDYQNFMNEYINFMKQYDRSSPDMIDQANELQSKYVYFVNRVNALKPETMSEADRNYYLAVTEGVAKRMAEINLSDAG
ncbi:MAG: zinc ribbon domain-containing protein [Oscillospiraceae bacterium]|nr:zinc ribbon domain-containing protein [Oscillospiraceae bacterium]